MCPCCISHVHIYEQSHIFQYFPYTCLAPPKVCQLTLLHPPSVEVFLHLDGRLPGQGFQRQAFPIPGCLLQGARYTPSPHLSGSPCLQSCLLAAIQVGEKRIKGRKKGAQTKPQQHSVISKRTLNLNKIYFITHNNRSSFARANHHTTHP